LLDEFALHAARQGVLVLRGQSLDQVTPRPLEALAGAAADLVAAVRAEPALGAAVRARVGEFATAAVTALPELSEILGEQLPVSLGLEAHGEARALAALIAVLDALGSPTRPAAILLDDCQWADELTLKLVAERYRRTAESHTLVVVAFRSEEVGPSHPLRAAAASQRLALAPLQAHDLKRLLESMAGALPEEAIGFVGQLSAGSPFLATAILEGLVEMGALRAGDAGWTVEMRALADAHSSRRAALVLARRIERLPPGAQRLLVAGAVLGRSFDLHHAGALARQSLATTMEAVAEARRRHLVWASADGTALTFVHDKIRDALLSRLPSEERRELHLSAATRLEATTANAIFDLAYHFDAAGRPERALPYALRAAAQARSQHALQLAELHYRIAWRGAGAADDPTRRRIAEALGEVLMLRGLYGEAAPYMERARDLAPTDLARAQAEARLGELVFRRGDVMASVPIFERALHLLGRRRPSSAWLLALMALREVAVQILHTLFPRLFLARHGIDGGERDLLEARIYGRLAYCTYMGRGLVRTVPEQLRQLNLAERYAATPELAQACITHAVVAQMLRMQRRFDRFAARSLELRRAQGDIWGQGQTLHFKGMAYFGGSKFAQSIAQCREAIQLLEKAGDRWEENAARFHIACSQYYLGELGLAVEGAQRNYRLSIDIGDLTLASSSLKPWALASGGEIPEDVIRTEMARPDAPGQTLAMLCIAEAVRLLHLARHAEAVSVLEGAYRRLWKTFLVTFHVLDLFAWLTTARRLAWEKAPPPGVRARRALLRRADRAALLARLFGWLWRNDLPHAFRESALLAAIHGRERHARRLLQRSLAEAERQGARYERAQTLLAWSRVGAAFAWPEARAQASVAVAELRAMGAKMALGEPLAERAQTEPTLSLVDRFAALLDAGRKIASALSRDAIHDAVRQSALDLLRGERCVLVEVGEHGALACAPGRGDEPFSRTLVSRTLAAGHPMTLSEASPENAGDSAIFAGVRSALCAPIFVRGRARLCLYTTHAKVDGLFAEDDERLAGFIATIAGAALENAEGFAEVQVLTRTLEHRVQERTSQLSEANRELATKKLQLEQQNGEIQRGTEQKSAFLASMSHELRTPLNAILGFTRLALKKSGEALPPLQRENLKKVEKSAVDLIGIVSDILDLSKVEAGKLSVRADSFELGDLVDEVLASAAPLVGERPLVLQKRLPAPVPQMLTDRVRLKQIVLNLISNAIKFTPSGNVTVDVGHDPATDRIRIAVSDTGIGIGESDAARIFEPFRQAGDADARSAGGTGLGLAIVRRLSDLLGGAVALDSHLGRGSCFTVEVPRVLPSARV
jgi:two-component system sensor kinase